jgi:hypothetical protein
MIAAAAFRRLDADGSDALSMGVDPGLAMAAA